MKRFALLLLAVFCTFSCSQKEFSAPPPPSVVADGPLEYVLDDLSGTVMIKSLGESEAEPAEEEQTVMEGDEIVTQAGSEAVLTLNEVTLVHLSENSDVKIDQIFRNGTSPDSFTSRLSLVAGKMLSEVEKLSESKSSFEIESGGAVCAVRGTSFEVEKTDSDVQTSTYHGAVEVQSGDNSQTVEASQHGDYSTSQGTFQSKRDITPEEMANYNNWTPKLALVRAKVHHRWEALRALDKLPPAQKQAMMQRLSGVQGKDRLKSLGQMMKDNQTSSNLGNWPSAGSESKPQVEERSGNAPAEKQPEVAPPHSASSVLSAPENHSAAAPQDSAPQAAPVQHQNVPVKAAPANEPKK